MARRAHRSENDKRDDRSFRKLFDQIRLPLTHALNAHVYSELPPFASDPETGVPIRSMFDYTDNLARWVDARIGTPQDRALADDFWRLRESYITLRAEERPSCPMRQAEFAVRIQGHDTLNHALVPCAVFVRCASPAIRVTLHNGRSIPADVLAASAEKMPAFADAERSTIPDAALLSDWLVRAIARRREALLAMTFLHMIGNCEERSVRSVFAAFPWLRGIFQAFGVDTATLRAAMLPWRGHAQPFHETISYAVPTRVGEKHMPADPINIERYLRALGEGPVQSILTRMSVARQVYAESRLQRPGRLFMFGIPQWRDSWNTTNPLGVVPDWVQRYSDPVMQRKDRMTSEFPEPARAHYFAALNNAEARPD